MNTETPPSPDPVVADILAVATQEFAQHGLAGARIERIQQCTRTSKRMVYYHFGSKEGLYRAVLEHAFETARQADQGFDPSAGTPEDALRQMVSNAFEAFVSNPAFVRLLTFENLGGAPFIRGSEHVSRLNRQAIADLQHILERGQRAGVIRPQLNPMDVYITMVGLCFYHVAHQPGYEAGGFEKADTGHIRTSAFHQQRKQAIQDTCWCYVQMR